jgi:hypothetical protein
VSNRPIAANTANTIAEGSGTAAGLPANVAFGENAYLSWHGQAQGAGVDCGCAAVGIGGRRKDYRAGAGRGDSVSAAAVADGTECQRAQGIAAAVDVVRDIERDVAIESCCSEL